MSLDGKVAIVTGSGRGLGLAYAQELARQGAAVVINDVDSAAAADAVASIEAQGGKAVAVVAPVGPTETAKQLVRTAVDTFGGLDILVTNAGVLRDTVLWKMSDEDFDAVIDVHLRGAWLGTREAANIMRENGSPGSIINVSSISGKVGNIGQTNYSAAKAGIVGLTKAAAKELGFVGIRVNAIQPGIIRTPMTDAMPEQVKAQRLTEVPLGRFGEPREVASVVLFLASDLSSYLTGTVIEIAGGRNI
jgi:3-oxoacyl-[acyl-carrier protein] reductase